jgi:hypothetical protein
LKVIVFPEYVSPLGWLTMRIYVPSKEGGGVVAVGAGTGVGAAVGTGTGVSVGLGAGVSAGAAMGEGCGVADGAFGTVVASTTRAAVGLGRGSAVAVGSGWTTGIDVAGTTAGAAPPPQAVKPIKTTRIAETTADKAKCLLLIFPSNAESKVKRLQRLH